MNRARNSSPPTDVSRRAGRLLTASVSALFCCCALTGCGVASYGLGVATMAADMRQRESEDYARYRKEAEEVNRDRARQDLPAEKPLSFRQWQQGQGC